MDWKTRGINFTESEPSTGMVPRETVIDHVRKRLDPSGHAPLLAARFGTMRSNTPAIHAPGEQPRPAVRDRYVWVVTLAGMKKPPTVRGGRPFAHQQPFVPAPMNYVMDGVTGEFIFAFG